jgi:hypothetical protein
MLNTVRETLGLKQQKQREDNIDSGSEDYSRADLSVCALANTIISRASLNHTFPS